MPFCKFHGTVGVKTIFLAINILRAISEDLFVTATIIMTQNDISRVLKENLRGARA